MFVKTHQGEICTIPQCLNQEIASGERCVCCLNCFCLLKAIAGACCTRQYVLTTGRVRYQVPGSEVLFSVYSTYQIRRRGPLILLDFGLKFMKSGEHEQICFLCIWWKMAFLSSRKLDQIYVATKKFMIFAFLTLAVARFIFCFIDKMRHFFFGFINQLRRMGEDFRGL